MMTVTVLIIAVPMSIIAAVMAFIITYEEYRHHYPDKRMAIKHGVETAVITMLALIVIVLIFSFFCRYLFQS